MPDILDTLAAKVEEARGDMVLSLNAGASADDSTLGDDEYHAMTRLLAAQDALSTARERARCLAVVEGIGYRFDTDCGELVPSDKTGQFILADTVLAALREGA